jgi:hypothetical protein
MTLQDKLKFAGLNDIEHLAKIVNETAFNLEKLANENKKMFEWLLIGASSVVRLENTVKKQDKFALRNLIGELNKNYNIGDKVLAEREMAEIIGHPRATLREQFKLLEAFGYVKTEHGRKKILIRKFEDNILMHLP